MLKHSLSCVSLLSTTNTNLKTNIKWYLIFYMKDNETIFRMLQKYFLYSIIQITSTHSIEKSVCAFAQACVIFLALQFCFLSWVAKTREGGKLKEDSQV